MLARGGSLRSAPIDALTMQDAIGEQERARDHTHMKADREHLDRELSLEEQHERDLIFNIREHDMEATAADARRAAAAPAADPEPACPAAAPVVPAAAASCSPCRESRRCATYPGRSGSRHCACTCKLPTTTEDLAFVAVDPTQNLAIIVLVPPQRFLAPTFAAAAAAAAASTRRRAQQCAAHRARQIGVWKLVTKWKSKGSRYAVGGRMLHTAPRNTIYNDATWLTKSGPGKPGK